MVVLKNKIVKKTCSLLSLAILSMVVFYTVVGNQVSASEVYPTITSTQTVETKNSNKLKD
jgi:hypothetical protein